MFHRSLLVTRLAIVAAIAALAGPALAQTVATPSGDWSSHNRTLRGDRYSPLTRHSDSVDLQGA